MQAKHSLYQRLLSSALADTNHTVRLTTEVHIPLHKRKLGLRALACGLIAFCLLALWSFYHTASLDWRLGLLVLLLFATCTISSAIYTFSFIVKLLEQAPGLSISKMGIKDNSTYFACGFMHWENIKSVRVIRKGSRHLLALEIVQPQKYISRLSGRAQKVADQRMLLYQTPYIVRMDYLDCNIDEIYTLIHHQINNHLYSLND
ncbi:MAG: hypothetical protein EAZ57_09155 [Cytophagales bacterium]|nr:MAG: hypothetical protein EAZ67_09960 [Cytophagales bacterium]TAF59934.1 MAG: hypothetical protein EAZ57_09155 [Cytophagales bacterium]